MRFLRINAQPFAAVALRKRADQQPFAFERYAANRYGQQAEEPKVIVHSPQIVETLNFAGAYALHGKENPDCKYPMPWCGGADRGYYSRYGGSGLRRFIVLPYGAKDTQDVGGVEVPVGPQPFVVSVRGKSEVDNINDYNNDYPHDAEFKRAGAEKALEVLSEFLGVELGLPSQKWAEIELDSGYNAETWIDGGFQNADQAAIWVPVIDDFVDYGRRLFPRHRSQSVDEQVLCDAWRFHQAGFTPEDALAWYDYGCEFRDVPSVPMKAETAQKWFDETGLTSEYTGSDEKGRLVEHFYAWQQAGLVPSDMWELESARKDVLDDKLKPERTALRARVLKAIGEETYPVFGSATPAGREQGAQFIEWIGADLGKRAGWYKSYVAKHDDVPPLEVAKALMQLAPGENVNEALRYIETLQERQWGTPGPGRFTKTKELSEELGAYDVNPRRKTTKQASQPITLPEGMMNGYRLAGIRDVRQMLTLSAAEISPKLAIEYHAAGIHSASEMLKLYRPWGISKKRVLPAYVRVFKDNGIHDVEQMHQIRKQLSMGPDYQPTYWPSRDREEDLAHLQFVIAGRTRRDAATSIRYLREEFTRLSPKFEEARERRQGTDKEEQVDDHIHVLKNIGNSTTEQLALFGDAVVWARTLDLQAYSKIPETEAHEISLWYARVIDMWEVNSLRRMAKQAMSPQAVAKLRAQYPEYEREFDLLVSRDPSGDNTYLSWAMRQIVKGVDKRRLLSALYNYHRLKPKIEGNLDSFPNTLALERAIRRVPLGYRPQTSTSATSDLPEPDYVKHPPPGTIYVGFSGGYDAFEIRSWQGAKALGTKNWCIVRDNDNWKDYADRGSSFKFLIDRSMGLPAKYALRTFTDGKKTTTEIYGPNDDLVLNPDPTVSSHTKGDVNVSKKTLDSIVNTALKDRDVDISPDMKHAIARAYAPDTVISVISAVLRHAERSEWKFSREFEEWYKCVYERNHRLIRKFEGLIETIYGRSTSDVRTIANLRLSFERVEAYEGVGVKDYREMERLQYYHVTPKIIQQYKSLNIDNLDLNMIESFVQGRKITPGVLEQYVAVGVTDAELIRRLLREDIYPPVMSDYKSIGVESPGQMLDWARALHPVTPSDIAQLKDRGLLDLVWNIRRFATTPELANKYEAWRPWPRYNSRERGYEMHLCIEGYLASREEAKKRQEQKV